MQQMTRLVVTVASLTAHMSKILSLHDFLGLFLYIRYLFLEEYTHVLRNNYFDKRSLLNYIQTLKNSVVLVSSCGTHLYIKGLR